MPTITELERLRLERGAAHLHTLGPRAIAELLADVAGAIGGWPAILHRLAEYQRHLTPAMVRAAGADRLTPRPLHVLGGRQ